MPKLIKPAAALSLAGAVAAALLYGYFGFGIFLSLSITFGTTVYHLLARLLSGAVLGNTALIRPDYAKGWFRVRPWEQRIYRVLRVKSWKNIMPTYSPEAFSPKAHTWEEIAVNTCRSELVHEVNALLSLVPLIAPLWFGAFWVFLVTSLCGTAFDLSFVAIQRYNRGRLGKLAARRRARPH